MRADDWMRGPIGIDAERNVTRAGCRTVLVLMPTVTAGARLLDLVPFFAGDHRIQTLFTVPDTPEGVREGSHAFARRDGRFVVPWQQAQRHRFDLVLAASHLGLDQVHGPILKIPHGATSLMSRRFSRSAGPSALPHPGLARETLMHRGRVLPSVLGLTHDRELEVLRRSCPEALPAATVAGDICYDRMVASLPHRTSYRRALGVRDDQRLVVISSTWARESAFGQDPDLCHRVLAELSGVGDRVALVLHPNVWEVHGRWQVCSWLAPCVRDGLLVIPPEEGWRAAVVAGDGVVGDHGSCTQYSAAIGRPVVLAAFPAHAVRDASLADAVGRRAPLLDPEGSVLDQLRTAPAGTEIAHELTSRPGKAAAILRRAGYAVLGLTEPDHPAEPRPVPLPRPIRSWPEDEVIA